jgi:cellulose synthase (UDP-forming)
MKNIISDWINDVRGKKVYKRFDEQRRRKSRVTGQIFSLAVSLAAIYYLSWCFINARWEYWYMAVPFLVTEFLFLILFLLWSNVLWAKRHHRPEGPLLEKKNFSVDIYIPACGEPVDIIQKTLTAALSIDYENKKVYVLDDNEDDNLRSLCSQLHAEYIRRPTHEGRKAGNLNYAMKATSGDLILAIDADQIVKPEIINSIIGYFTIDPIGFVQTKQSFNLPKDDPWGNADEVFYKVMMPGKDYDNAAISCGSGVMYRRKALDSIGGFSSWNLVEDLYTSLLLHCKGWRSVYHDTGYTEGTAPRDVISHSKQRWQWAVDSQRMFIWNNPLFKKGLGFYQRLQYFHTGFHYIVFGLFLPVFFMLPIWALFTHHFMLREPFWYYIAARAPYFLLYVISNKIITEKLHTFKVFQAQAGLFAVYFNAFFAALFSKNKLPQYTVTQKVATRQRFRTRLSKCMPHIILITLSIASGIYGIMTIKNDFWFLFINLFWASWTVSILWRFPALSLFPKRFIK